MYLLPLEKDDQPRIWEFLRLAAHEDSIAAVQNAPLVARYAENWGREGDFGFVAWEDKVLDSGVCWARFYPEDEPGFGFVSPQIPEISLAVRPQYRGRGVGSAVLEALIIETRRRNYQGLSLSVREDNVAALRLYQKFGFKKIAGSELINRAGETSSIMRWDCR